VQGVILWDFLVLPLVKVFPVVLHLHCLVVGCWQFLAPETQETLGKLRLGHICFLFLVIPELPLDLGCALSTLVCSSSNNDDDNNQMMVMILIIIILIVVIIIQVSYIELRVFTGQGVMLKRPVISNLLLCSLLLVLRNKM